MPCDYLSQNQTVNDKPAVEPIDNVDPPAPDVADTGRADDKKPEIIGGESENMEVKPAVEAMDNVDPPTPDLDTSKPQIIGNNEGQTSEQSAEQKVLV